GFDSPPQGEAVTTKDTSTQFAVFSSLLFAGMPDLNALGIAPLHFLYEQTLFPGRTVRDESQQPTDADVQAAVLGVTQQGGTRIVIDIEIWPTYPWVGGDQQNQDSLQKYSR